MRGALKLGPEHPFKMVLWCFPKVQITDAPVDEGNEAPRDTFSLPSFKQIHPPFRSVIRHTEASCNGKVSVCVTVDSDPRV